MEFLKNNVSSYTRVNSVDAGLRSYMLSVYNYMSVALLITAIMAYFVGSSEQLSHLVFGTGLMYFFFFAPLVVVFMFSSRIGSMSLSSARTVFFVYAALIGVSLGSIFLVYTGESITRTFFITSSMFGALSLYGYTTKKDISGWGSFLLMGLFGIIIASLVNLFMQSPAIQFVTSIIGVIVFTGLTAYDTQRIKNFYNYAPDAESASKFAIMGALSLYMDFLNLFLHLLRFFGDRRS